MKRSINIAIDGPSGVGKSTVADAVAQQMDMIHLDTGAMYRCVAYYIWKNDIDTSDEDALRNALIALQIRFEDDRVYLNDEDVSEVIRTNDISMMSSKVSALPVVREVLVKLQQEIARKKGYILDGRDICSVVLPDAEIKIYMDASAKARADRRYSQYVDKGIEADYDTIYQDIVTRDFQDMNREYSPLKKADDAVLIDTSDLTKEQVIEEVMKLVNSI